jgi:hypothetical protein
MPKPTYVQLNNITLAASSSSITFNNIPQNYRDLVLVGRFNGTDAATLVTLRFNGDSSNYTGVQAYGSASPGSNTVTTQNFGAVYGSFLSGVITQIMDYSATDKHKVTLQRFGNTQNSEVSMAAYRWASTAVITSISFFPNAGVISASSNFTLYGIEA